MLQALPGLSRHGSVDDLLVFTWCMLTVPPCVLTVLSCVQTLKQVGADIETLRERASAQRAVVQQVCDVCSSCLDHCYALC